MSLKMISGTSAALSEIKILKMKKIISVSFLFAFLSFSSFGQSSELVKLTNNDKQENCTPTKECAEKMGMTLEECKKLCTKTCAKTGASSKIASVSMESSEIDNADGKKSCIKSCSKTKVASATAVNDGHAKTVSLQEVDSKTTANKKCSKTGKCCKKREEKDTKKTSL